MTAAEGLARAASCRRTWTGGPRVSTPEALRFCLYCWSVNGL